MEWDFITNNAVDSLEVMPEAARVFYVENKADGNYVVDQKFKPFAEAYVGANKKVVALNKQKGDDNRKDAARRVIIDGLAAKLTEAGFEVPEDHGTLPDFVSGKIAELMETVKGGKEVKTNLDAIKKDFDKRLADALKKKDDELGSMKGSLDKHMIDSSAAIALANAGTVEKGLDLLMPMISKAAKVVKDESGEYGVKIVDGDNNVRMNNQGNPMSIADLVGELKTSYPMAFKSDAKAGTGSPLNGNKQGTKQVIQNRKDEDMSPTQKIAAGLAAGLHKQ